MRTPTPWLLPTQPASTASLLAGGASRRMIDTRVRRGELLRLRPGVYLAASAWPEDPILRHLILAHAEVAANPRGVLSHQSAATAWGLPSPGPRWHEQPVAVTLAADRGTSTVREAAVHHVALLPAGQVDRDRDGYPVTSLARTAVDLAAALPLPEALVILDAVARRLCAQFVAEPRRSDFCNARLVLAARQVLAEVARDRRRSTLLAAIALTEPCRESPAESLSAGHFELAAIPRPEFQAAIRTPLGTFFPDCLWRDRGLIGECDGAVKYDDPRAYVAEKQREQALRDLGYQVVRWLGSEISFRPETVVGRVRRALGEWPSPPVFPFQAPRERSPACCPRGFPYRWRGGPDKGSRVARGPTGGPLRHEKGRFAGRPTLGAVPFTPSHIAAVLPLRRAGRVLPFAALAAGSLSPDLPYYLPWLGPANRWTHTAIGVVTVDLVIGLALWALWRSIAAPLDEVLPAAVRERWTPAGWRVGTWWGLPVSVAIGASTHVGWDEFTHPGRFFTTHLPLLAASYPGPLGPLPGYAWAQYGSGVFGLVVLGVAAARAPRSALRATPPPRASAALGWLCGAAFAVGAAARMAQAGGLSIAPSALVFAGLTGGIAAAGAALLVVCWGLALLRRAGRSQPG